MATRFPKFDHRAATLEDLDDLAAIACAAFPADPVWDYMFPYRKEYPDDHFRYTKEVRKAILEEEGLVTNVITMEVKDGDKQKQKPIAMAVWELVHEKASKGLVTTNDRPDADPKRREASKNASTQAKKENFDSVYGDRHIHLMNLATHPDWQGHGAGTQLCKWGIDIANKLKVPVTVLSSPMGGRLYSHLGFEKLGHYTVQVDGEEEKVSVGVMIKTYKHDGGEKAV